MKRRMLAIVAPILLAGCTEMQFLKPESSGPATTTHGVSARTQLPDGGDGTAAAIGRASNGVVEVPAPDTGVLMKVRVHSPYSSAGGGLCRGYETPTGGSGGIRGGLVCRGNDGTWRKARLLVEPHLLRN